MILVCAPTRTEAGACRRGLADAGARDAEVLWTGVGPVRAAAALAARLRRAPRPALVVSSGFAGALTADVPLHAVVTATRLERLGPDGAVTVPLPDGALRVADEAMPCRLVSASGVVLGGAAQAGSAATGGALAAVDMESAALAEVTAEAGLPFAVLRVVTDTPSAPLPPLARTVAAALASGAPGPRLAAALRALAAAALHPTGAAELAGSGLAGARALRAAWRARGTGGLEGAADDPPAHRAGARPGG